MPSELQSTSLYHVYVDNTWTGPFDLEQLRILVQDGKLGVEGFAYDHEAQEHILIGRLLGSVEAGAESAVTGEGRDLLSGVEQALAGRASPLLRDAVERIKDRLEFSQDHRDDLRRIAGRLNSRPNLGRAEELRHLLVETVAGDRQAGVLLLDELVRLLDVLPGSAPGAMDADMIEEARAEVGRLADELGRVQQAYDQVLREHDRAVHDANASIERLEYELSNEREVRVHCQAEIRMLAAEILRLAQEARSYDPSLSHDIERLENALSEADLNDLAIIAERLLVQALTRFRDLARTPESAMGGLMHEIESLKARFVEVQKAAALANQERDEAVVKLEEQRHAASVAMQLAKQREKKLRSTVTALEITRDLYQDSLRELETKLGSDSERVAGMEDELARVRMTLEEARDTQQADIEQLEETLRRAVEMRATLKARQEQLQSELSSAKPGIDAEGQDEDEESGIRRAAQLEETLRLIAQRLGEQESEIELLSEEIKQRRDGTSRLRGRSDELWKGLDSARGEMSLAKRRFNELQAAYDRIDTERESLLRELQSRKGTETIGKDPRVGADSGVFRTPNADEGTGRITRLKVELAEKQAEVEQVSERNQVLQARLQELTADREYLKTELDRMRHQQGSEQERTANALAEATKATIAAEKRFASVNQRLSEKELKIAALEAELAQLNKGKTRTSDTQILRKHLEASRDDAAELELKLVQAQSQTESSLRERIERLEAELAQTRAELQRLKVEYERTSADRDRLQMALERMKSELESAAVEHRASLKSARDRLTETQAQVQQLQLALAAQSSSQSHPALPSIAENATLVATEQAKLLARADDEKQTARKTIDDLRSKLRGIEAVRHHADGGAERVEKAVNRVARLRRSLRRARRRVKLMRKKVQELQQQRDSALLRAQTNAEEAERLTQAQRAAAEALGVTPSAMPMPGLPGQRDESGARPLPQQFTMGGATGALSRRRTSAIRSAMPASLTSSTRIGIPTGATRRVTRTTAITQVYTPVAEPASRRRWWIGLGVVAGSVGLLAYGLVPMNETVQGIVDAEHPITRFSPVAGIVRSVAPMAQRGNKVPEGTLLLFIASNADLAAQDRAKSEALRQEGLVRRTVDQTTAAIIDLRRSASELGEAAAQAVADARARLDQVTATTQKADEAVVAARTLRDKREGERDALRRLLGERASDNDRIRLTTADRELDAAQDQLTAAVRALRQAQDARIAATQAMTGATSAAESAKAAAAAWATPPASDDQQPLEEQAQRLRDWLKDRHQGAQVPADHQDQVLSLIQSLGHGLDDLIQTRSELARATAAVDAGKIVMNDGCQLMRDLPAVGAQVQHHQEVVRAALPNDRIVRCGTTPIRLSNRIANGADAVSVIVNGMRIPANPSTMKADPFLSIEPSQPDQLNLGQSVQLDCSMGNEGPVQRLKQRWFGWLF